MTTEEFENTLLQVCFIRIVTCCDYLNWLHSPEFWKKNPSKVVLITREALKNYYCVKVEKKNAFF